MNGPDGDPTGSGGPTRSDREPRRRRPAGAASKSLEHSVRDFGKDTEVVVVANQLAENRQITDEDQANRSVKKLQDLERKISTESQTNS